MKNILKAALSLLGCSKPCGVANLAGLSSQNDLSLDNGCFLYVNTVRSIFILDRTSTQPVDGITVVATLSGVGRWLRLPIAHPSWLSQATWFIDPAAGDDENVGSTAAAALKTHAELTRRWSTDFSTVVGIDSAVIKPIKLITVTLLGSLPASDPINLKVSLGPNTLLAYVGTPTPVRVGTFTAVTVKNRTTNTPWEVADADPMTSFSAADVGKRVRITGGDVNNVGQFAWVAKDMGAGVMRMSSFSKPTMPGAPDVLIDTGLTSGGVAVLDSYVVEDLTQVTVQSIQVDSPLGGTSTNTIIGFVNIDFRNTSGPLAPTPNVQGNVQGVVTAVFKGCSWDGQLVHGRHVFRHHYLNCRFGSLALNLVSPIFRGGLCLGQVSYRGGLTTFDNDFMVQGGNGLLIQASGALFGTVCVFDSALDGFRIGTGDGLPSTATCLSPAVGPGVHRLWGAGNAGAGISISGGSVLSYQSTVPTVTGKYPLDSVDPAAFHFLLAGAAKSRAWDEALGKYTDLLPNTWKNLAAAIAPGPGFGGNAHNVERNAHIVLR